MTHDNSWNIIKQYGDKRTGTNAVRLMIQKCFPSVVPLMHVLGDKHSPPVDFAAMFVKTRTHKHPALEFVTKATIAKPSKTTNHDHSQRAYLAHWSDAIYKAYCDKKLGFAISIKHPYSWIASLRRYENWSEIDEVEQVSRACDLFNYRYWSWLTLRETFPRKVLVIRSETLLSKPTQIMKEIAKLFGLPKPKSGIVLPDGLIRPTHWDNHQTQVRSQKHFDPTYYTEARYLLELSWPALKAIDRYINWNQLKEFGYVPNAALSLPVDC